MIITSVDVYMFQFKRQKPILCKITTDEGIYGWGEAGIAYGIGQSAAFGMVKDLAEHIIGRDPMQNEAIWEDLYKTTFWALSGGPIIFAGMSAIDIALMDIKGKKLNTPCYNLMGGKQNDNLRTYASQIHMGWGDRVYRRKTVQEYADVCKYAMECGYDAVKLDFCS